MSRLAAVLALFLIPGLALAAKAPAAPAKAVLPSLADPAAAWQRFLADKNVDASLEAYETLHKIYGEDQEIGADCAEHLDQLDRDIARVPVAVALWDAGEKCARQVKDEARADRYGEGLLKLASFALSRDSTGPWNRPIRVLNINDVHSLVDATGMEVLYSYVDTTRFPLFYPITVALWDKEAGSERHLSFDFLESLGRLRDGSEHEDFPVNRIRLRNSLTQAMKENEDELGLDLSAVSKLGTLATDQERVDALRATAANGGLASLQAWLLVCHRAGKALPDCGPGLVDALLPWAEEKYSAYRVQLALAYAMGVGVDRDEQAAWTLLDSAEARWGGGNALGSFAEQWMDYQEGALPAGLMTRLEKASTGGSLRASAARLRSLLRAFKGDKLDPATLELTLASAKAGLAKARMVLVEHYQAIDDETSALEWMRKGAEAGDADAMERYASEWIYGWTLPRNESLGIEWMRKAAEGGDSQAMSWMGSLAEGQGKWYEAEGWYMSSAAYEDWRGVQALARFYSRPHPGVRQGPKRALELFERIESAHPSAAARRDFAGLLMLESPVRDLARARKLLERDAQAGDDESQFVLGMALLEGRLGKADPVAGMTWVDKARIKDEGAYADGLAYFLFYSQGRPDSKLQAMAIERELVEKKKYTPAMNNLAWWQCTSADPALRRPAEGLALAKRMGEPAALSSGYLDTLAACHAAAGEFDRAVQLQEQAVARQTLIPGSPESLAEMGARLEAFRRKQAYEEKPQAK